MKIKEPAREIEVIHSTDVLVVGSGPAGLASALAASRSGVHVTLLERFGCFGGNITAVGVEGFAWYRHDATIDSEGIGIEFEERAKRAGASVEEPQAGVTPMLHRMFVAPVMEGNQIKGAIVESKAGREAILAKRVIDATGDADVAYRAGAPTVKQAKQDMIGASVMFSLSGVNKQRFIDHVKSAPHTYADWAYGQWTIETTGKEDQMFSPFLRKPFERARAEGLIPTNLDTISGTWGALYDAGDLTYLNLVHLLGYDGTDPQDLTHGEMEGRRQAMLAVRALQEFQPGCESAKLRNFGMTLGIRDTRKIDAVYNMTELDVREQARFDESVGIFPEFIDGYGILILPTTGRYFHLPYRTLLPKGVENLICAGRITGGDRVSHAATRNMMCCAVTGQAAGTAAALSVKRNEAFDSLSVAALQDELKRQGARLH